ncbi:phenylacetate-CoA oxygenase subunit PaaC [Fictibacillus sp. WQ 8-8]|uniref:1,2-phenylacetyl-CoA epoxidase subunit PaaC n=1 Tax=unclassified Fictibacillus TaxID=2644029 RepID=UPI002108E88F|nr:MULTISPECIES: 1,2-phenylacetyl-CoA epoxidase subunit PaaC [unclassified Fictibacillus]MCQ6267000.1 phenylacetate-CoA oxygenase subunit PaaC [Fictibacillus sp. WQ 8-8]MED2974033.1 phenylacetate-CoA oxygenase subunit PaaC [Fictibacillus sp. B-59209]
MTGETLNQQEKKALKELIYQLADDDFILAYRGSEWLGLAPHIEEDVAFSSINQDMMGHASMYYHLLEDLGEGEADRIAHLRKPEEFRNAILLERVNGSGTYLDKPDYDWAFAVVRNYFYAVHKHIRLESLRMSSYEPLANAAKKIMTEQYYHLMHWDIWFKQLVMSTEDAKQRMLSAVDRVWRDFGGVLTLGPFYGEVVKAGLIEDEPLLKKRWLNRIEKVFSETGITVPGEPLIESGNGRKGEHTPDLAEALSTLSEVFATNPASGW